jgi:hypothetical protein
MNRLTRPNAQMLLGIARSPAWVGSSLGDWPLFKQVSYSQPLIWIKAAVVWGRRHRVVYLRHKLHTADLTKEAYNRAISEVIAFIDAEKKTRPYLGEFMEARGQASGNQFLIGT